MEIADFQTLVERIYFERDQSRGIPKNFMRLIEEVGELSEALFHHQAKKDAENLSGEFADVFAWLTSLASLSGVRLEEAITKYTDGCPACHALPCTCAE